MADLYGPESTLLDTLRRGNAYAFRLARGAYKARFSGASLGGGAQIAGRTCFRIRGTASFGRSIFIDAHRSAFHVHVGSGSTLTVGDNFMSHAGPSTIAVRDGGHIIIGDRVGMNAGALIEAWHEIRIGNRVRIAPNVYIIDDSRHEIEPGAVMYKGPVVIGDGVWLGRGVSVMPGASIGAGSVIAAHSVVTGDIPAGVLAGGAPARVIRKLELPDGWIR
jgi:maltose O-acetyltransferase